MYGVRCTVSALERFGTDDCEASDDADGEGDLPRGTAFLGGSGGGIGFDAMAGLSCEIGRRSMLLSKPYVAEGYKVRY